MSDLVSFLQARLDEDERAAQAAQADEYWHKWHDSTFAAWQFDDQVAEHVRRLTPARMLAEVEAKRWIIDMWEDDPSAVRTLPDGVHDGRDPDEVETQVAVAEVVDDIVRILALPYADHPDYDPAWAVETAGV